jgi:hypothetical protein
VAALLGFGPNRCAIYISLRSEHHSDRLLHFAGFGPI